MQRSIRDEQGEAWDVMVGRESYGMQVWLFSPRSGGEVRKALMESSTRLDAMQELEQVSEEHLRERLGASVPWSSRTAF